MDSELKRVLGGILEDVGATAASGQGKSRYDELLARAPAALARRKESEWRARLGESGVPKSLVELARSFDGTEGTLAVAKWFGNAKRRHLMLRGGVGCGKSVAAATWLAWLTEPSVESPEEWTRRALDKEMNPKHWAPLPPSRDYEATVRKKVIAWVRPDTLVSAVIHNYDAHSPELAANFVLDDLGLETKAGFEEALCETLDSDEHKILITTNLDKEALRARYSQRLLDRLNDSCAAVDLSTKSMRKQNGGF